MARTKKERANATERDACNVAPIMHGDKPCPWCGERNRTDSERKTDIFVAKKLTALGVEVSS